MNEFFMYECSAQELEARKVPDWVVRHLGGLVSIREPFDDGVRVWPAQSMAYLQSIQAGNNSTYVTCVMLGASVGAEENFSLSDIVPGVPIS
jgi:hypothetical protein